MSYDLDWLENEQSEEKPQEEKNQIKIQDKKEIKKIAPEVFLLIVHFPTNLNRMT